MSNLSTLHEPLPEPRIFSAFQMNKFDCPKLNTLNFTAYLLICECILPAPPFPLIIMCICTHSYKGIGGADVLGQWFSVCLCQCQCVSVAQKFASFDMHLANDF